MKKFGRRIIICVECILLVGVVISLFDRFKEIFPINLTPVFAFLMLANIVIAIYLSRKEK